MKKKSIVAAIAVLAIVLIAGSSIAYFNSSDSADNVFIVGNVKIELTEPAWNPEDEHIIKPNAIFDKDPTVKNIGDNDAYVRIHVTFANADAVAEALGIVDGSDALDLLYSDGVDAGKWTKLDPVPTGDEVTFTYVYKEILPAEESTGPLFDKVTIPETTDMEKVIALSGDGLEIKVWADAIQSKGFANRDEAFKAFDDEN